MQGENPPSSASSGKRESNEIKAIGSLGVSQDYALVESAQSRCSVALKNRFEEFFRTSPEHLTAIPGPNREIIALEQGSPHIQQAFDNTNLNPTNPLKLADWLTVPASRITPLVQPITCSYKSNRAVLSFPPVLWRAGLVPGPSVESIDPEKRTVVLIAGADFLVIWRYDFWANSIFAETLPSFWQNLLISQQ